MWVNRKLPDTKPVYVDGFEVYSGGERGEFVIYRTMNWYRYVCIGHPAIETHWLEDKGDIK